MTVRLKDKLTQYLIINGKAKGKAQLSLAIGKSVRMLDRYLSGDSVPSPEIAYNLALAAGCTKDDALEIATECLAGRAKETA